MNLLDSELLMQSCSRCDRPLTFPGVAKARKEALYSGDSNF